MTRLSVRPAPPANQPASLRSTWATEQRADGEAAARQRAQQVVGNLAGPPPAGSGKPQAPTATPSQPSAASLKDLPDLTQRVLREAGEPLAPSARACLEPRFGCDFSQVRVHRDMAAAQSAQALSAQAYTVGTHLVFDTGRYAPDSPSGRAVLAHELSHVMQQTEGGLGPVLQRLPTQLSDIPESERTALRVDTVSVTVPSAILRRYFVLLPSGNPAIREPVHGSVSFGSTVPTGLQSGLTSVAGCMANLTNGLPLNSSVEVDLDLSAFSGGNSSYRFTYFAHTEGSGSRATHDNVMLIELIGSARTAAPVQTAVTGAFTVNGSSFTASGSWNDTDFTLLHEALSLLPEAARTGAAGLTFRRTSAANGDEAGRYLAATDTIELNNLAFPAASNLRVGQRSPAVRTVLHEVGHALDLRGQETAWRAFNAAGQSDSARRTFLADRSQSGSRYVAGEDGDYHQQEEASDATPAFRRAVARDGVRRDTTGTRTSTDSGEVATLSGGITRYSETNYEELYAEAFSLYMTAPETLRLLRPATYAFFLARFPRPAATATSTATGSPGGSTS